MDNPNSERWMPKPESKITEVKLKHIASDTEGTNLSEIQHFPVSICEDFLKLMASYSFRGATHLVMQRRSDNVLLSAEELQYGSDPPIQAATPQKRSIFRSRSPEPTEATWVTQWEGEGYLIGRVEGGYTATKPRKADLYLCSDGLLRCWRDPSVFSALSRSSGVGSVPLGFTFTSGVYLPEEDGKYYFHDMPIEELLDHVVSTNTDMTSSK